tara:strand:+ start:71 stop:559 length:489 start_codon:yes stop_codon:yes gene_type:complete
MFKHSFVYTVFEDFVEIDSKTKEKIKKIKLNKSKENKNNFSLSPNVDTNLEETIKSKLNFIFNKLKLTLQNCWVQKYGKYDYHSMHTHFHTQHDYSFIWYIEGGPDSACTKFFDVGYPLINTGSVLEFNFKPGMVLLFPGFLPHEVPINKSNNRLVVSGNLV